MKHYCIYTRDFEHAPHFISQLSTMGVRVEPHLNRTRFWLDPQRKDHVGFLLKYSHIVHTVDDAPDSTAYSAILPTI
jgi:hypothetical protein